MAIGPSQEKHYSILPYVFDKTESTPFWKTLFRCLEIELYVQCKKLENVIFAKTTPLLHPQSRHP